MGKPRAAEWRPRFDRGQYKGGQAGRSNFFKLSLQLGAMQVVVFSFGDWCLGLTVRRQTVALREILASEHWHRPSKDLILGVISDVWRSFFRWNYHRRVSRWSAGCAVFKSASSGREEQNRHVRALSVYFERPRSPTAITIHILLAYARTHTPSHVPPSHSHAHTIQCYCRYRFFVPPFPWLNFPFPCYL